MQFTALLLLATSLTAVNACLYPRSTSQPSWSYTGATGPLKWHTLSPEFATCGTGSHQSPVDLTTSLSVAPAGTVVQHYPAHSDLKFFNNGHTVEAEPAAITTNSRVRRSRHTADKFTATIDGELHELLQFHFHTPSEHTLHGRSYPLEAHFVHRATSGPNNGSLAVVGVMFDIASPNARHAGMFHHLAPALREIPHKEDTTVVQSVELQSVLDNVAKHGLVRYSGSLTTPPCDEKVSWFVSEAPMAIDGADWQAFSDLLGFNSRFTQGPPGEGNLLEGECGEDED
ncbi:alpha carbonic anhydrase [Geopyxis carbonaria]|nr:alpha carbonic anhydrase [Geopyxis carbonaria]